MSKNEDEIERLKKQLADKEREVQKEKLEKYKEFEIQKSYMEAKMRQEFQQKFKLEIKQRLEREVDERKREKERLKTEERVSIAGIYFRNELLFLGPNN